MTVSSPFLAHDFQALFESAPGLYLVLKPDLTIAAVSNAYLHATMTKREEILDRGIFDVFPDNPDDPDADGVRNLKASLKRVLEKNKPDTMPVQKYDIRRPEAEGGGFEERFWSPVNSPVVGTDGKLTYIIHQVEDVTEFIHLQQQRNEQIKLTEELRTQGEQIRSFNIELEQLVNKRTSELEVAIKELEAFSYSVSHDLRAPLRHIGGYTNLLQKNLASTLNEANQRYLTLVSESVKRMDALIEDLLEFSRTNRQQIAQAQVDMQQLVKNVLNEITPDTKDRNIQWNIEPLSEVLGDYALLKQVWMNLLTNAVKYTKNCTQTEIHIGCLDNSNEITFFIRDNGVGFDMEYADKLFGVFQRLHRGEDFEGTGIGLANVRRIIMRHNGRTWAESRVNEGATFYFSIPKIKNN
jgi:signal transduction histidine kinase